MQSQAKGFKGIRKIAGQLRERISNQVPWISWLVHSLRALPQLGLNFQLISFRQLPKKRGENSRAAVPSSPSGSKGEFPEPCKNVTRFSRVIALCRASRSLPPLPTTTQGTPQSASMGNTSKLALLREEIAQPRRCDAWCKDCEQRCSLRLLKIT